jgi:hypothetical protein
VLAGERALDSIRSSECAAAQCTECGGAKCTSEHPLLGGTALVRARQASAALLRAVAAARGVAVGEGPMITLAELRSVLVRNASLAEPTADVLLSHLRRYAPVLQLKVGLQDRYLLEICRRRCAALRCRCCGAPSVPPLRRRCRQTRSASFAAGASACATVAKRANQSTGGAGTSGFALRWLSLGLFKLAMMRGSRQLRRSHETRQHSTCLCDSAVLAQQAASSSRGMHIQYIRRRSC